MDDTYVPVGLEQRNLPHSGAVMRKQPVDNRPLVMHIVFRFDTGGLENGIVNLINHLPGDRYRHAVLALTEVSTEFSRRIQRDDVEYISLRKPAGQGFWQYARLYRLFRERRPHIVHSRNLAAMEALVPAWLAGVPVRIHGEHGRDVGDLDGNSRRYQWVRRAHWPFVSHCIALSRELTEYVVTRTGLSVKRVTRLCNGVDTSKFAPAPRTADRSVACPFAGRGLWLIGTVGRMQVVKDQVTLAKAFVLAVQLRPALRDKLRLVLVGDGPLKRACEHILSSAGVADLCWLPGERDDVADIMRELDCFVLPSRAEGISNTILEAMATGLPVVATRVGGNSDLVLDGVTGEIVPRADPTAMARALISFAEDPDRARAMGFAGRARAEEQFSIQAMVTAYQQVYDGMLAAVRKPH